LSVLTDGRPGARAVSDPEPSRPRPPALHGGGRRDLGAQPSDRESLRSHRAAARHVDRRRARAQSRFLGQGRVGAPARVAGASLAHAQWKPDGAVVCDSVRAQSGATVIADGSGGSIIAWQDERSDTLIDIFVQRLNNAGIPQWTAGGVSLGASVDGGYTFSTH